MGFRRAVLLKTNAKPWELMSRHTPCPPDQQVPIYRLRCVHPEPHRALPHPLSGLDLQAHAVPQGLQIAGSHHPSHPVLQWGPQQERPHGARGVWAPQVTPHLVQPPGGSRKSARPGLAQRRSGNTPRKHRSQSPSIPILLKNSSIRGLCRWGATPTPSAAHTPAGSLGSSPARPCSLSPGTWLPATLGPLGGCLGTSWGAHMQ